MNSFRPGQEPIVTHSDTAHHPLVPEGRIARVAQACGLDLTDRANREWLTQISRGVSKVTKELATRS